VVPGSHNVMDLPPAGLWERAGAPVLLSRHRPRQSPFAAAVRPRGTPRGPA